ncbi:MAG: hypothetical protein H8E66_08325 [Planctomycetes bacterium]|nr:hypothetical protein [Planctomycetota bacterium]
MSSSIVRCKSVVLTLSLIIVCTISARGQEEPNYPIVLSVTGDPEDSNNPQVAVTQVDYLVREKRTFADWGDSADNRDVNGVGNRWLQSEYIDRTTVLQSLAEFTQYTATGTTGEYYWSDGEEDHAANGVITRTANKDIEGEYANADDNWIVGSVSAAWKAYGVMYEDETQTDETTAIETYEKSFGKDVNHVALKEGYEITRILHPEGVEWIRTDYLDWARFHAPELAPNAKVERYIGTRLGTE